MSEQRSLSRRTALAGLGAGSLGLLFGSHAALPAVPNRETGSAPDLAASNVADHPLTGLWLSHVALSADGDETAAAPAFFGADGTAVLVYPCAEASENGTQIRGLALGTWARIDDRQARFTAVQVCFGADGSYQGTRTYDGYPVVSDDGTSFTVQGEFDLLTVRDAGNAIIESRAGGRAMFGTRMAPGYAGFTAGMAGNNEGEPEADVASEAPGIQEVAPVHPADPRLAPTPSPPGGGLNNVQ